MDDRAKWIIDNLLDPGCRISLVIELDSDDGKTKKKSYCLAKEFDPNNMDYWGPMFNKHVLGIPVTAECSFLCSSNTKEYRSKLGLGRYYGGRSVGNMVSSIGLDYDHDNPDEALRLVLKRFPSLTAFVSKQNGHWHAYARLSKPTDDVLIKQHLNGIMTELGLVGNKLVEVFPKTAIHKKAILGNSLRLPWGNSQYEPICGYPVPIGIIDVPNVIPNASGGHRANSLAIARSFAPPSSHRGSFEIEKIPTELRYHFEDDPELEKYFIGDVPLRDKSPSGIDFSFIKRLISKGCRNPDTLNKMLRVRRTGKSDRYYALTVKNALGSKIKRKLTANNLTNSELWSTRRLGKCARDIYDIHMRAMNEFGQGYFLSIRTIQDVTKTSRPTIIRCHKKLIIIGVLDEIEHGGYLRASKWNIKEIKDEDEIRLIKAIDTMNPQLPKSPRSISKELMDSIMIDLKVKNLL